MAISIKYDCDGSGAIWPIPFAFLSSAEVGVRLQMADGTERALVEGRDYLVKDQTVICVQPAGMRLIIWQNAASPNPSELARAYSQRQQAASPQAVIIQNETAADPAEELRAALEGARRDLADNAALLLEEMRRELGAALEQFAKEIRTEGAASLTQLRLELAQWKADLGSAKEQNQATLSLSASYAARAQEAVQTLDAAKNTETGAVGNAEAWARASQRSADESYNASCHAWDAATQASIHSRRPGVCAVHSVADIHACSPGLFIINPHLTHAPTPFFGVWPARNAEEMAWDGVFFIRAQAVVHGGERPGRFGRLPAESAGGREREFLRHSRGAFGGHSAVGHCACQADFGAVADDCGRPSRA